MAQPWLAWLVWDLLSALLVLLMVLAPALAVAGLVYVVVQWRRSDEGPGRPTTSDDAEPL